MLPWRKNENDKTTFKWSDTELFMISQKILIINFGGQCSRKKSQTLKKKPNSLTFYKIFGNILVC